MWDQVPVDSILNFSYLMSYPRPGCVEAPLNWAGRLPTMWDALYNRRIIHRHHPFSWVATRDERGMTNVFYIFMVPRCLIILANPFPR